MKLHGTSQINEKGHLEIGGVDALDLVKKFGTPLYVMDEALLRENCRAYYNGFTKKYGNAGAIYASKTNLSMAICRIVEQEGLGLDVVSGGELHTAQAAGFPMEKVYFHGNNKTPLELEMALDLGVGRIVVDNLYEMNLLNALAGEKGKKVSVLMRITPGIEAHTHEYIQTGQIDSKFGFTLPTGQALEAVKEALTKENLILKGMHCHIGSQIFELHSFEYAALVMMDFLKTIRDNTGVALEELNLGGGFGIYYTADDTPGSVEAYADLVMAAVQKKATDFGLPVPRITVEPGRSIAGPAGSTLYTIGSIKEIQGVRKYVAVDGGMTDNPRPAMYDARYEACLANKMKEAKAEVVSITGKCCESGDMLIWDISLPQVDSGDILAVSATGAYNYSMSSNYNRLIRPAMVLVGGGQADLIVKRETFDDLIRNDVIPARLGK